MNDVVSENAGRFAGVRATYDPLADALYLYLCADRPKVAMTWQIGEDINADLARDGTLIGFEILGVSHLPLPGSERDDD